MTVTIHRHLPPELTDYAIDFLHTDLSSLRSCALTCRTWLPSARFHLFNSLPITNPLSLAKITHLIASDPHTAARVTSHVRTLSISKSKKPFQKVNSPIVTAPSDPFASIPWETHIPQSLSPHFPSLNSLHLDGFLSFWQPSSFTIASYASFKSIKCLSLSSSSLKSLDEFTYLLRTLPELSHLSLDAVTFGNSVPSVSLSSTTDYTHPAVIQTLQQHTGAASPHHASVCDKRKTHDQLALSSLTIRRHTKPLDPFLDWLISSTISGETLRELSFPDLDPSHGEAFQVFLDKLGDGLERLEIGVRSAVHPLPEAPISLQGNSGLTVLTLHLGPLDQPNKWIHPLLNSISGAYNLRTLILNHTPTTSTPLNHPHTSIDWNRFDQHITRLLSSRCLQTVLVKGVSGDDGRRMPEFRSRGG